MASTSAREKAMWHEGDECLALNPRDCVLREATIHRLTTSTDNEDTAWVTFTHHKEDAEDEEEQEEEAIPVSKLRRPGLNRFTQEKPVFPRTVTDSRLCVPLELSEEKEDRVPYTINRYLRDYQREGIRFMYNNYIRSKGCILGDDMGLGKTVQVIGFLAGVLHKTGTWEDIENNRPQFLQSQNSKRSKPSKVFLIVAPLSVLYNWKDELDTWGHFQCVVVHGLRKEEELARIKKGRIEIALTTYETLRLCLEQFNKIDWCAVVVDEAHKIKNPNSQISQAMKELKCKIRIGLTGTILQNNLEELWCVMDWAIPGCLGSIGHFKTRFSDPIEQGQRHSATKRALATGRKTVRGLVRRISPWFLRRTKALIKDQLPKKDDRVVYCSLTDFQQTVYQAVLDTEDVMLLLRSSEKCACQSGRTRRSCCYKTNSEGVQIQSMYFSYLAILRKVANHVALLQSSSDTSQKQEKYVKAICTKVFQKFPDFVQRCKNEAFEALSDPMYSGKMKVLQKLLKHYLQKKDKVLIFSLSTKLLDVLESYCMAEGLDFSRLDGSTSAKQRVQMVKDFNSSPHINLCLVSTMAGGLGLNFVGANVVVLFDPTWNPANDLQAIDRAYRIGQCRDVTVLRLISLGTVEEVIYLRQVYKQQLQSSVVGKENARRYFEAVQGGIHKGELFGIKNLFRLQTQGTCLTRLILEREGQVEAGVMTTSTHSGEEKEQEAKGASEPGVSSTFGPATKDEPAKETSDGSEIPKGVLDFNSGSEEEGEEQGLRQICSNLNVHDTSRSGNAATSPGQTGLLQQTFSRLLERAKEQTDLGEEGFSSDAEESPFQSDGENQMIDPASTGKFESSKMPNGAVAPQKLRTKTFDTFCRSDPTHEERAGNVSLLKVQGGHSLEPYVKEKNTLNSVDKKKDGILKTTLPKQHCFKGYSDESEDFDLDSKMSSKKDVLNSPDRGGKGKKRPSARTKARAKYTEDIETFTSSEDECTTPKHGQRAAADTPGRRAGRPKSVSFTCLKSLSSPASKEKTGNIDNVLGGVHEVAYIHSNQRVVGGSKAEERISRAAVRDVFEHNMYSQLPANHLLGNEETLSESLLDSQPPPATVTLHSPSVDHPVTFCSKSVHHTKHTTFIIGETPKAIRRKQLEEMAEKFKCSSVHQFAQEILNGSSAQRLTWLQEYYTSLNHPDLARTVKNNFPQPDSTRASFPSSAASSSSTTAATKYPSDTWNPQKEGLKATKKSNYGKTIPEVKSKHKSPRCNVFVSQKRPARIPPNEGREPPKKQKVSQKNVGEDLSDIPSPESEEESVSIAGGCNQTKRGSVSSPGAHKAGGGLGVDRASSSGLESREAAAFHNHTDRHIPSFSDLSHDRSNKVSKATGQSSRETSQGPSTSSNHSFLTDLLGDISVLDDLLKPKPRSAQKRSDLKPSHNVPASGTTPSPARTFNPDSSSNTLTTQQARTPERAAKGARKDFWDILNEGNEESFNRLTDLEEVQRVCITKSLAARDRPSLEDNKSLWKTNEKFLWKK